jgi:hypothetical protein
MPGNIVHLLKARFALAVVGAVLVAAVTATVVVAATGARAHQPLAAQTPSPAGQCAPKDQGTGHTSTPTDDGDETAEQDANQHAVSGTIASVDTAGSTFVLTQCDGTSATVAVSKTTEFGESTHGLADLKAGMFVEVEGTIQSNGTLSASNVRVEHHASAANYESSSGDEDDGRSGTSTPAARSDDW